MLFAVKLAVARGYADETERVAAFVRWVDPAPLPVGALEPLLPFIARDKKHLSRQRWVLLGQVGQPHLTDDVTELELRAAWDHLQQVTS